MNDDQINKLLEELVKTRESFDSVAKSIKWNKINTIIQYSLLVLVFVFGALGVMNYANDRRVSCERSNDLRATLQLSMQENAFAIGSALVVVTNASQEKFDQYLAAYQDQKPTEAFGIREC